MAYPKSIVVFLSFALILSFVVEQSSAQHLRWGKRNEMETDDQDLINKGRWAGKLRDMESNFLQMWKRAYLAGKYSNRRRKSIQ
ncbi:Hypothetical predicted protein [Paramuricea clavata]|uniref:Uncharacterized protein n=1 Tax=Paramuricea clavata TaxID=317549 RepID=A0A7D9HH12_PARCT|nr:Hypothetical predicted protein [Paramuricea clavata]